MFKPARMTRLLMGGHKEHMAAAISVLHAEGALHIEDYEDPDGVTSIGTPLVGGESASDLLVRVRGLQKALGTTGRGKAMTTDNPQDVVAEAEREIVPVVDGLGELRGALGEVTGDASSLAPFAAFDLELSAMSGLRSIRSYVGLARESPGGLQALDCEVDVEPHAGKFAVAAFVVAGQAAQAEAALADAGFAQMQLREGYSGTPAQALAELRQQQQRLEQQIDQAAAGVAALSERWGARLAALERHLTAEVERTQAPLQFGETASTFHVEGWVPKSSLNRLENALSASFGDQVYVHELGDAPKGGEGHGGGHDDHHADDPGDEAPVHLEHQGMGEPYIYLLNLLARPRYKEIDPTVLMAVFFPLFFGLMVGDLAVGLVIFGAGVALKKRYVFGIGGPSVGRALMMGGLMAALVGGVVFGEALGIHFVVGDEAAAEGELSWEILMGAEFPEQGFIHKEVSHHGGHAAEADTHGATETTHAAAASDGHGQSAITTMAEEATVEGEGGGLGALLSLTPHGTTHLSVNGWFNLGYYSKVHDVTALLLWSIIIGLTHLVLGLLIGIRNVYVSHGAKLAVQEKVAWLTLMGGAAVTVWGLGAQAPAWGMPIGVGIVVASIALLWAGAAHVLGAGFVAILEVFGLVGNVLSYTRLAAIGASKAGMAIAFSAIGFTLAGQEAAAVATRTVAASPVWWITYVFGMVVIILLAMMSGGLQSLRLQYVEFFGKFYEGGGRAYLPFGRRSS